MCVTLISLPSLIGTLFVAMLGCISSWPCANSFFVCLFASYTQALRQLSFSVFSYSSLVVLVLFSKTIHSFFIYSIVLLCRSLFGGKTSPRASVSRLSLVAPWRILLQLVGRTTRGTRERRHAVRDAEESIPSLYEPH